ncbi:MAG: phosphatase PAP2 family protein [Archangium sp.]
MLAAVLALALSQNAPTVPHQLKWEPRVDIPVTTALVGGWVLSEFAFKKQLGAPACRWCATNGFDVGIRSIFNPSMQPSADGIAAPHIASNLVGFVSLPILMVGLDVLFSWREGGSIETFLVDVLIVLETTFSALAVNQFVKFAVGRGRPYTVGASEEVYASGHDVADNNLSFFSGHATFTFALASSAATVATLRGYKFAWLMWAVGIPLATATSILRLAADKHWTTDILIGSAFGLATGILMPTFLHGRVGPVEARVAPMPNGLAVTGRF